MRNPGAPSRRGAALVSGTCLALVVATGVAVGSGPASAAAPSGRAARSSAPLRAAALAEAVAGRATPGVGVAAAKKKGHPAAWWRANLIARTRLLAKARASRKPAAIRKQQVALTVFLQALARQSASIRSAVAPQLRKAKAELAAAAKEQVAIDSAADWIRLTSDCSLAGWEYRLYYARVWKAKEAALVKAAGSKGQLVESQLNTALNRLRKCLKLKLHVESTILVTTASASKYTSNIAFDVHLDFNTDQLFWYGGGGGSPKVVTLIPGCTVKTPSDTTSMFVEKLVPRFAGTGLAGVADLSMQKYLVMGAGSSPAAPGTVSCPGSGTHPLTVWHWWLAFDVLRHALPVPGGTPGPAMAPDQISGWKNFHPDYEIASLLKWEKKLNGKLSTTLFTFTESTLLTLEDLYG
jgi:hypothetical protein